MARRMEAMERRMEDLVFELGSERQKNVRERLEREQEVSGIKCRAEVDLQVREMEWKREKEAILRRQDGHQLPPAPVEAATGVQVQAREEREERRRTGSAREDPGGMWDNVTRGIYLPPSARRQGGTARSKQRQARGHSMQAGDRFSAGARLFPSSEEEDEVSGGSEAEDARSRRRSRHRSRHSRIRSASSSDSSPSQDRLRRSVDRGHTPPARHSTSTFRRRRFTSPQRPKLEVSREKGIGRLSFSSLRDWPRGVAGMRVNPVTGYWIAWEVRPWSSSRSNASPPTSTLGNNLRGDLGHGSNQYRPGDSYNMCARRKGSHWRNFHSESTS